MLCYEIKLYTILYNNEIMSGKNNYNVNLPVMIIYCTLYWNEHFILWTFLIICSPFK